MQGSGHTSRRVFREAFCMAEARNQLRVAELSNCCSTLEGETRNAGLFVPLRARRIMVDSRLPMRAPISAPSPCVRTSHARLRLILGFLAEDGFFAARLHFRASKRFTMWFSKVFALADARLQPAMPRAHNSLAKRHCSQRGSGAA